MWGCGHDERITDAMEGALSVWRRLLHGMHLRVCRSCQCTERELRATVKAVGSLPHEPPSPELKAKLLTEFRSRCKRP